MSDTSKALEALDRIFNYCEEIDLHIPEKEQTGYSMNDDVAIIREALFENQKTGHWIAKVDKWGDVVTTINGYKCSVCGGKRTGETGDWIQIHECKYHYCPDCGAKMEGE